MDLYYLPGSAPCRGVQLAAKAVGVELNLKMLNLMNGEHLKPEFVKVSELKEFFIVILFWCNGFVWLFQASHLKFKSSRKI